MNAALISQGVYTMSDTQLAAWYAAALGLLTLFYIRPSTVTRDALRELDEATPPPAPVKAAPVEKAAKP